MHLKNKVVFVTGGARGIGSACAKAALERGAKVVLVDVHEGNGLLQTGVFKEEFGQDKVIFKKCDVSKTEEFKKAFTDAVEQFGTIDVLVNNAGVLDELEWTRTLDINLKGVIQGTELAYSHMRKDKGGSGGVIINIASIAGYNPIFMYPVYAASKHGVIGYTRSLANAPDVTAKGIRYACVCPETVDTDILRELKKNCREEYYDDLAKLIPNVLLTPSQVGVAVMKLLEDDDANGAILEVSPTLGLVRRNLVVESL